MKIIAQTGYTGSNSAEITEVPEDKLLPSSLEITTTFVPLLPYDVYKLNGKIPVNIPSVLGYGALGKVTKTGALRSKKHLGERVLVLNPAGTFKEKIVASIPPLTIAIPDEVSDEQAGAIIGGLDTALTLAKKIKESGVETIVLTGANSVIGLALLQLLKDSGLQILPMVRKKSQDYFEAKREEFGLPDYPEIADISPQNTLVVDIAGQENLLAPYLSSGFKVLSIALQNTPGVRFVSEFVFPGEYVKMFDWLKSGKVVLPIDQVFSYKEIRKAVDYQAENPSRGRNLIAFGNDVPVMQ
ncbi:hypothetical protein [Lactovum odontotermitis]